MSSRRSLLALVLSSSCFVACAPSSQDTATSDADLAGASYGPIEQRLASADLTRWQADRAALDRSFGDVCGDTFCSGDYANLTTVALACSATKAGYVKECTWVLAGSIEYVDGATGAFNVDARTFTCSIPVKTKVDAFLTTLETKGSGEIIHLPMPGTGASFYDAIGTCLSGVVGKAPPPSTGTKYQEMIDFLSNGADPGPWFGARDNVDAAFAQSCPGQACGGGHEDIAGLRLACAVDTTKSQVKACRITLATAVTSVSSKGKVAASAELVPCDVKVKGTPQAVIAAFGSADPLHAKLPGSSKNLADQLTACAR